MSGGDASGGVRGGEAALGVSGEDASGGVSGGGKGCRRCEWRGSLNYPGDCLKQGSGHRKNIKGSYSPA